MSCLPIMKTSTTELNPVQKVMGHRKTLLGAVAVMLIVTGLSFWVTTSKVDQRKREDLLQQARLVAQMICPAQIKDLSGGEADLTSPSYLHLKKQLMQARQANSKCRFFYILGRWEKSSRHTLFFYVDSEPEESKDYSPPGQIYEEASDSDQKVFDNKTAFVEEASTDRWGTWISALVPISDPSTGEMLAVLGMDIDACIWKRDIAFQSALPMGLAFVLLIGLLGFLYTLLRRSELHMAEQQESLRKNEERLKFAMEGANDGIWEIDLRTNAIFLSPRGYEMFGYTQSEKFTEEVPTWDRMVFPDDRPAMQKALAAHLNGQTPFLHIEQRLRTRSGTYLWILSRGKISERDADGRPLRMTGTHTDITDRKQAESQVRMAQIEESQLLEQAQQARQVLLSVVEDQKKSDEALKEERRRLASIIKGTNVGTWEWTIPTGELVINDRWVAMIGYTSEELAPISIKTWEQVTHPDDCKASYALLERHFKGELNYYENEFRMRHKNGRWVWVLDRGCVASWTADGKPLLMSGKHTDITERKQTEKYRQLTSTILTIFNKDEEFRYSIQQVLVALKQATECGGRAAEKWRRLPLFLRSRIFIRFP